MDNYKNHKMCNTNKNNVFFFTIVFPGRLLASVIDEYKNYVPTVQGSNHVLRITRYDGTGDSKPDGDSHDESSHASVQTEWHARHDITLDALTLTNAEQDERVPNAIERMRCRRSGPM